MNVLLIEDDPTIARSIEMLLASEKHSCRAAASGIEGLTLAEDTCHDIIILDLMLPDLDGFQVLRQLKITNAVIPVLILSGISNIEQKTKAFESGADDFLTKPFNRAELLARVKAMGRRTEGEEGPASTGGMGGAPLDAMPAG